MEMFIKKHFLTTRDAQTVNAIQVKTITHAKMTNLN